MRTVHFMDLMDRKVTTIERGMQYVRCYPYVGIERMTYDPEMDGPWRQPNAQASLTWTMSGLMFIENRYHYCDPNGTMTYRKDASGEYVETYVPYDQTNPGDKYWFQRQWVFKTTSGRLSPRTGRPLYMNFDFASTWQLTDVPIEGWVGSNFLLDVAALRRDGITVDTTTIDVPEKEY